MKTFLIILATATLQIASAAVPAKAPKVKYTGLWTNSPFTSKPPPPPPGEVVNPFEDFILSGIAPVPGGYRITIISKKDPNIKKVIEPGGSDKEFTVVSVDRNPAKALGTTVVLSAGSIQGTVSFEPDMITLKAAPAAAPQKDNANLPPGVNPQAAAKNNNGNTVRQPRPRIVPPPTRKPSTSSSGNKTTTQGSSSRSQPRIQRRR